MARLYPQALDSLFVANYDSQGYGGVIRHRHHTGYRYIRVSSATFDQLLILFDPCVIFHVSYTRSLCNQIELTTALRYKILY
jgi:hypothetical protein